MLQTAGHDSLLFQCSASNHENSFVKDTGQFIFEMKGMERLGIHFEVDKLERSLDGKFSPLFGLESIRTGFSSKS